MVDLTPQREAPAINRRGLLLICETLRTRKRKGGVSRRNVRPTRRSSGSDRCRRLVLYRGTEYQPIRSPILSANVGSVATRPDITCVESARTSPKSATIGGLVTSCFEPTLMPGVKRNVPFRTGTLIGVGDVAVQPVASVPSCDVTIDKTGTMSPKTAPNI